ncbi:MAG: endopeptidase La, partial [Spirochaetota bacterium]
KLRMMEPNSSEYTVTRNYLDTLLSLPWNDQSDDDIDIRKASRILNKDHFGLDDVKERILEFLAVKKLKPDASGSIICLVGPPGVGKTSLGRSIARSLNREFFRMSLGGMRDEAEIKGHRRTYVGAMPGKIMQGIKITRTNNPVFMLDEIDKLGQSYQGDPASALLEVLDPEQNSSFRDHYLDVPFDLSNVFFITTANTLDSIPRVLLDRMEVIRLSGYISEEKYEIAKRYLLPKQVDKHGLDKNDLKLSKQGFLFVIQSYAREAGVRNLERNIEKLCRKSAAQKAKDEKLPEQPLSEEQIKAYLGPERYTDEEKFTIDRPGLVNGLAWTNMGGAILVIEALGIRQLKGHGLKITGQLGDVMSESANIAYSYVRQIVSDNDEYARFFNEHLIHLHVPAGATPKDGPSAGITMATALFSLVTNTTAKSSFAMTGELTLTGKVFPIGGLKEKLIAAKRAKIKNILYPHLNERDLQEVPDHVRKGLKFYPVSEFTEVLDIIFPKRKI